MKIEQKAKVIGKTVPAGSIRNKHQLEIILEDSAIFDSVLTYGKGYMDDEVTITVEVKP